MDGTGRAKRPRGRPPKVKRGGVKGEPQSAKEVVQSSQDHSAIDAYGTKSPCATTQPPLQNSPPSSHSTPQIYPPLDPSKSQTAMSPSRSHTPKLDGASDYRSGSRNMILPARRSARQATVYATQVSEGTLRPSGPPHLEAALSLALRNLESETWGYLWPYYEKRQGEQLPTPAEIKAASSSVRRAADAVDKADRALEEAVDEMMSANIKKKRRGPALSKYIDSSAVPTPTPTYISQEVEPTSRRRKEREKHLPPDGLPGLDARDTIRGLSPIIIPPPDESSLGDDIHHNDC